MNKFNLANFMRAHLYASVGVLKIGNDILFNEEKIRVDRITGHGGLFRTKGVGQRVLAAAINLRYLSWKQPEKAVHGVSPYWVPTL